MWTGEPVWAGLHLSIWSLSTASSSKTRPAPVHCPSKTEVTDCSSLLGWCCMSDALLWVGATERGFVWSQKLLIYYFLTTVPWSIYHADFSQVSPPLFLSKKNNAIMTDRSYLHSIQKKCDSCSHCTFSELFMLLDCDLLPVCFLPRCTDWKDIPLWQHLYCMMLDTVIWKQCFVCLSSHLLCYNFVFY